MHTLAMMYANRYVKRQLNSANRTEINAKRRKPNANHPIEDNRTRCSSPTTTTTTTTTTSSPTTATRTARGTYARQSLGAGWWHCRSGNRSRVHRRPTHRRSLPLSAALRPYPFMFRGVSQSTRAHTHTYIHTDTHSLGAVNGTHTALLPVRQGGASDSRVV